MADLTKLPQRALVLAALQVFLDRCSCRYQPVVIYGSQR